MTARKSRKEKSLALPLVALVIALAAFVAIQVFLSQAGPAAPPTQQSEAAQAAPPVPALGGKIVFRDAKAQGQELVGYYHTIALTPEQEAIKKAALEPMPAACCRDSSAYTCCCPCNLSKTIWGLSNLAISKYGANAAEVKQVVEAWMGYVNPNGFTGDSCYHGGCNGAAHGGGCGGMDESKLDI